MLNVALIIGRFQPLHQGHVHLIQSALKKCKHLIIAIGSHNAAPNAKNPFTTSEREALIRQVIPAYNEKRVTFCYAEDWLNDDNKWAAELKKKVYAAISDWYTGESIHIIGHVKDKATYSLVLPDMLFEEVECLNTHLLNATKIRQMFFENYDPALIYEIPEVTVKFLRAYKDANPTKFFQLAEEYQYLEQYKKSWSTTPFPVTFNCVDAVVFRDSKILLIRRGQHPGKGLLALPGGFIDQYERIGDAVVRELKEETNISLSEAQLKEIMSLPITFDAPNRSLRGRIITFAYMFILDEFNFEIQVNAGDDAESLIWVDIEEIKNSRDKLFSDHYEIIYYMIRKYEGYKSAEYGLPA